MATCGCPRQGGCRGAVPPLRVYPQFGAHHPPLLCPPSPSAPLIPPPIASIISPAEGGGGWGWGGAKAAGVSIPIAAPGCCRCGDTGDSQEPGPRCHHHWGGKQSTSHLPRYPPGAGVRRQGGGQQAPKTFTAAPTPPLAKVGSFSPGMVRRGETEARGRGVPALVLGRWEGPRRVLFPPKSLPFSAPPDSSPRVLPRCRMWLCQAASLHPKRLLQLITPPNPRCPAPNHTVVPPPPPENLTLPTQHPKTPQILPPKMTRASGPAIRPHHPRHGRKATSHGIARNKRPPSTEKHGVGGRKDVLSRPPSAPNKAALFLAKVKARATSSRAFSTHICICTIWVSCRGFGAFQTCLNCYFVRSAKSPADTSPGINNA